MAFEEVKRISEEWAVTGLNTMHNSAVNRPFRFIYMSGNICERDQTKVPSFMPKYLLMRVNILINPTERLCTDEAL
jgi:hypothetical protein